MKHMRPAALLLLFISLQAASRPQVQELRRNSGAPGWWAARRQTLSWHPKVLQKNDSQRGSLGLKEGKYRLVAFVWVASLELAARSQGRTRALLPDHPGQAKTKAVKLECPPCRMDPEACLLVGNLHRMHHVAADGASNGQPLPMGPPDAAVLVNARLLLPLLDAFWKTAVCLKKPTESSISPASRIRAVREPSMSARAKRFRAWISPWAPAKLPHAISGAASSTERPDSLQPTPACLPFRERGVRTYSCSPQQQMQTACSIFPALFQTATY